jgi:hypothetical protein
LISWFKKTTETAAAASVSAAQKLSFSQKQQKAQPAFAPLMHQSGSGNGYFANQIANNVEPVRRQSRFNPLSAAPVQNQGQHGIYGQR